MAALTLTLRAELDLVYDAIDALARAHEALVKRHGERFRQLERDIEALSDARLTIADPHQLGEGIVLFEPPKEIVALVARARGLCVI